MRKSAGFILLFVLCVFELALAGSSSAAAAPQESELYAGWLKMYDLQFDDAHRIFVRAAIDPGIGSGPVNLAAPGKLTLGEIAAELGRPIVRVGRLLRGLSSAPELDLLLSAPSMNTALLGDKWNFTPAWTGPECLQDVALAVRGRVSVGSWSTSLPWRLIPVQDIPAVDIPAADVSVVPLDDLAGAAGERHCRDPAQHEALDLAVVEHHRVRLVAEQAGGPLRI